MAFADDLPHWHYPLLLRRNDLPSRPPLPHIDRAFSMRHYHGIRIAVGIASRFARYVRHQPIHGAAVLRQKPLLLRRIWPIRHMMDEHRSTSVICLRRILSKRE
jgi:hypothetical protein